jgi:uncharacterized protein Smg (DUF494 family)
VLTVDDPRRALMQYCAASDPSLENTWEIALRKLVSSSDEFALEAMRWILVRFGWTQPNMEAIKRDMDELTQRSR